MMKSRKIKRGYFGFLTEKLKSKPPENSGARSKFARIVGVGLIFSAFLNFACVNKSLLKNNNVAAIVEEKNLSQYERDLETMKTANFDYIYAFRRKDAGVFDTEDKKFLRANTPPGTNRFVATDEERAFIAGSRYVFSPENLAALQNRFLVENYSKPAEQLAAQNINQNTSQNTNRNTNQNVNATR